jgi:SulP family sulfate permease
MMEAKGVRLHLSGLKLPAMQVLERAGLLAPGPMLFSYRTDGEALAALTQQADASPLPKGDDGS